MSSDRPIVISWCDKTCRAVAPWVAAGFESWCVDLQHPPGITRDGLLVRVGADVRYWLPPRREYLFAMGFPPCTDLSVSGARWFRQKGLRALATAIDVFGAVVDRLEWCECPAFAENPVSVIASHYRPANESFNPCDYAGYLADPSAEAYTKRTNLWTFGGFVMPEPKPVFPLLGSLMHKLGPSEDRGDKRAVWAEGFAAACFEANRPAMAVAS